MSGCLPSTSNNTIRCRYLQSTGLTGAVAISGGQDFSLALKNDGTVWAWGQNNYGQLGNGYTTSTNTPVQVSGLTGVMFIAAGP